LTSATASPRRCPESGPPPVTSAVAFQRQLRHSLTRRWHATVVVAERAAVATAAALVLIMAYIPVHQFDDSAVVNLQERLITRTGGNAALRAAAAASTKETSKGNIESNVTFADHLMAYSFQKKGAPRSKAYSDEECHCLAVAMLNARRNPRGVIKSDEFQQSFLDDYNRTKHSSYPDRNVTSLLSKWTDISACVQKFKGNYQRCACA